MGIVEFIHQHEQTLMEGVCRTFLAEVCISFIWTHSCEKILVLAKLGLNFANEIHTHWMNAMIACVCLIRCDRVLDQVCERIRFRNSITKVMKSPDRICMSDLRV